MAGYDYESGESAGPTVAPEAPAAEADPVQQLPPAVQRFKSCRWRKNEENGVPDHCSHRDVQPMAGTAGFNAEAWCPECGFYKVRRTPRKGPPPTREDRYY